MILLNNNDNNNNNKENLSNRELYRPGEPQSENQRKRKKKQQKTKNKTTNKKNKKQQTNKQTKTNKYLHLARELKMLWNRKVTRKALIIGVFGTVPKSLVNGLEELEIRGRAETIQTTALLRSTRILKRDLEIWGDLLLLRLHGRISS